ncbi:MAG: hypothetical protein R3E76_06340 [Planctomycetota bacterium]
MPINLRYGQQAVARGFLDAQRLQQVLSKQRQLAEQGKKVSVRMILEKAKLLDKDQLSQIDRDLNIKVVKKHTSKVQKPGVKESTGRVGAQNFAGDAVPQFSGMQGADPDATVFSPPPPDMQQKVRAERERAKADARAKQEAEAANFMGSDDASPFGGDPFGNDMAPEPFGNDMAPEPFGGDMQPEPFGNEMQPEPFGNDMQPEPFGGGDLAPEPMGFGDDSGSPFGDDPYAQQDAGFGNEPAELERMDSSPKLASLGAEYDGFASPDDEELPTINTFDDAAPANAGGYGGYDEPAVQQPSYGGPSLAPAGDDFDGFGNDIRSPEDLESAPTGSTKPLGGAPDMDATMFSPPPPGIAAGGRQKTGAMDRTVFSPRPPEMGGAQPMEAQPAGDDWGEDGGFDDEPFAEPEPFQSDEPAADMDATLFSPPPAQMPPARRDTGRQQGRAGADDFADVELPQAGHRVDDVPTAPASMDDEVHPLRRGVGTSSASVKQPTGRPAPGFDDDVADELPGDDGGVDLPSDDMPDEDLPPIGKGKGKLPPPKKGLPTGSKRELPKKEVPAATEATDGEPEKKKSKRVLLAFVILLLIVVGILTLPVALYDVPEASFVRDLRDNPSAKPVYDYVDYEIFNRFREWTGQPIKDREVKKTVINIAPPDNSEMTGESNESGDTGGGEDAGPTDG